MKIPSALIVLLFLSGCGGSPTDLKAKEYKGRLEDKAQGLAFRCPEKWEIRENVHGHRAIGRSPRESAQDTFQENLVVSGPLQATSAEEAAATAEVDLAKQLKEYKQVSLSGSQLDFTHRQQGQSLRCRQLIHPNGKGAFWVVTFTSTEADFSRWEPEFGKIWASFGAAPAASASPRTAPAASATPAVSATPAASVTPSVSASPAAPAAATPAPAASPRASAAPAVATPAPIASPPGP